MQKRITVDLDLDFKLKSQFDLIGFKSLFKFLEVMRLKRFFFPEVTLELEIKAQKSEVNLLEKLDRLAVLAIKRLYRPWLYNDFIYQLFSEGREFNREIGELMELVKERLAIKKKIIQDEINNGIESKGEELIFLLKMLAYLTIMIIILGVDLETDSKRRLFWRRLAEHFDDWGDEEVTHHAITMILTVSN